MLANTENVEISTDGDSEFGKSLVLLKAIMTVYVLSARNGQRELTPDEYEQAP